MELRPAISSIRNFPFFAIHFKNCNRPAKTKQKDAAITGEKKALCRNLLFSIDPHCATTV
jgi:hypothetical protein